MSSKRHLRRKACDGKVRHKTQQDAIYQIISLRKDNQNVKLLKPYRCKFCKKFHIGHKRKTRI